jgi:hypothetical protein
VGGSMRAASAAWWLAMIAWTARTELFAQTIRMDATPGHVVNTFSRLYALGATVRAEQRDRHVLRPGSN